MLAGWNGLAISALAFGGRVLGEPRFVAAAARAAEFVLGRMVKDGRLQRTWLEGEAGIPAFLEDHAFLAAGLLDLHEATFEPRWLEAAVDLCERQEALFGDTAGAWFQPRGTTTASSRARSRRTTARSRPARRSRS